MIHQVAIVRHQVAKALIKARSCFVRQHRVGSDLIVYQHRVENVAELILTFNGGFQEFVDWYNDVRARELSHHSQNGLTYILSGSLTAQLYSIEDELTLISIVTIATHIIRFESAICTIGCPL